ncbi:MAG: TolC family protein [Candidatus Fermentibacteraceae bacterium]
MTAAISLFLAASLAASGTPQPGDSLAMDLSGWVSTALEESPDVASSRASVDIAEAGVLGSRSFLWPDLGLSASAGHTWTGPGDIPGGTGEDYSSYSYSLTLSQELLGEGGASWLELSASRHGLQAARASHRQQVLSKVMDVISAYYGVVEARELLQSARRAHRRSTGRLERTQALYDVGGATSLELTQARVGESGDRLAVARRRQSLTGAYYDLYEAAGLEPDGRYAVNFDAVLEPLSTEEARSLDIDYRDNPGLTAAKADVREASASLSASKRAYWPTLSARGSWSWSDDEPELAEVPDNDSWNVSLNLSWSIFDGWFRESRIQSARGSYLRSRAALESVERSLATETAGARDQLLNSIESYRIALMAREQAEQQLDLSRRSYEMGATSLLDLLDAQQQLAEAEASVVSARMECLLQEAQLLVLLGRTPRLGE